MQKQTIAQAANAKAYPCIATQRRASQFDPKAKGLVEPTICPTGSFYTNSEQYLGQLSVTEVITNVSEWLSTI